MISSGSVVLADCVQDFDDFVIVVFDQIVQMDEVVTGLVTANFAAQVGNFLRQLPLCCGLREGVENIQRVGQSVFGTQNVIGEIEFVDRMNHGRDGHGLDGTESGR